MVSDTGGLSSTRPRCSISNSASDQFRHKRSTLFSLDAWRHSVVVPVTKRTASTQTPNSDMD